MHSPKENQLYCFTSKQFQERVKHQPYWNFVASQDYVYFIYKYCIYVYCIYMYVYWILLCTSNRVTLYNTQGVTFSRSLEIFQIWAEYFFDSKSTNIMRPWSVCRLDCTFLMIYMKWSSMVLRYKCNDISTTKLIVKIVAHI